MIRPGKDSDGAALIALIWSCWSRHPGIRMDVDGEMPELHALASYYKAQGGMLWVAEDQGALPGMIAVRPVGDKAWEICRVYVDPARHGDGLGHELLNLAENHAIDAGAETLVLWSDTRFDRAHRFYEKRSYVRYGPIRVLNDISNSLEYGYAKPVRSVRVLDIAAATSASRRLGEILVACVDAGESTSFLPPLSLDKATGFYRNAAANIGKGLATLVGVWRNGLLVGAGLLDLDMPENQPHRAEVRQILVDPAISGADVGRIVIQSLEQQARASGRSLLTLAAAGDPATVAGDQCENWHEAGRIPGYAIDASGNPVDIVFLWKSLT